jgi:hypothetical protein
LLLKEIFKKHEFQIPWLKIALGFNLG